MAYLIHDFAQHLQIADHLPATVETYTDLLRRLDRQLPYGLAECCHDELVDAIYVPGRKPATRALYRAAVRAFFVWAAADDGPLDFDPAARLPKVKVPKGEPDPIMTEQLADILHRAAEPYRTWYLLAAYAGLRCVEISRLDREHITPRRIRVNGKGGKVRTVDTHPGVWAAVRSFPAGPIARNGTGGRATRKDIRDRGNRHLQRSLGLREVHMHRLRHWFGTEVYQSHGEFVAQRLLGHESPATTAGYARVASARTAAAVAALPLPGGRYQSAT